MLKKISIRNLTELNNTMCAAAADVSELVRANKLPKAKKEPWRKRRVEGKLKELVRDLDSLSNLFEKRSIEKKHKDRLDRKYNIRRKRLNIVREEMKQRIGLQKLNSSTLVLTNINRIRFFSTIKDNFFND